MSFISIGAVQHRNFNLLLGDTGASDPDFSNVVTLVEANQPTGDLSRLALPLVLYGPSGVTGVWGGVAFENILGSSGRGFVMPGSATYAPLMGAAPWTIEFWMRPGTVNGTGYVLWFSGLRFIWDAGTLDLTANVFGYGAGSFAGGVAPGVTANTWHFVALTGDNQGTAFRRRLWLNGSLVATSVSGVVVGSLADASAGIDCFAFLSLLNECQGIFDQLRLTRNVNRYPGAGPYPVPSGPFPTF